MNPVIPKQVYINPDNDDDGKSINKTIAALLYCHCPEVFSKDYKMDKGDDNHGKI